MFFKKKCGQIKHTEQKEGKKKIKQQIFIDQLTGPPCLMINGFNCRRENMAVLQLANTTLTFCDALTLLRSNLCQR